MCPSKEPQRTRHRKNPNAGVKTNEKWCSKKLVAAIVECWWNQQSTKNKLWWPMAPHWGKAAKYKQSLFIFDFKIATANANRYFSIKSSSATHSFSNCAWVELIWSRMYWHQLQCWRLKLSESPVAYLASQYHFLSFLNIHTSLPPIQHILIQLENATEILPAYSILPNST